MKRAIVMKNNPLARLDIQQVFYRMDENVSGCYAQKPIKAIDRVVKASSLPGDLVIEPGKGDLVRELVADFVDDPIADFTGRTDGLDA